VRAIEGGGGGAIAPGCRSLYEIPGRGGTGVGIAAVGGGGGTCGCGGGGGGSGMGTIIGGMSAGWEGIGM